MLLTFYTQKVLPPSRTKRNLTVSASVVSERVSVSGAELLETDQLYNKLSNFLYEM